MWRKWRALFTVGAFLTGIFVFTLIPKQANASTGINQDLSFEGKVVTSAGVNIPDGTYNMEFKIYNASTTCTPSTGSGCTLAWTEDWLVGSSEGGIAFTSGTFQVNLGATCPFSGGSCESYTNTAINWNTYPLYLSMQIGNTSSCTISTNFTSNCGGDTEMKPYILLDSTPFSINSSELGGLAAASFAQLSANQTFTGNNIFEPGTNSSTALQMDNAAGNTILDVGDTTANLLSYSNFSSGSFTTASTGWAPVSPGSISQNTTATDSYDGQDSLVLDTTSSNGGAETSAFTSSVGAGTYYVSLYVMPTSAMNASAFTLTLNDGTSHPCSPASQTLPTTTFTRISCGDITSSTLSYLEISQNDGVARSAGIYISDVQLQPTRVTDYQLGTVNTSGEIMNTPTIYQNSVNSTTAFQVQSAAGYDLLDVDTTNNQVIIGTPGTSGGAAGQVLFETDTSGGYGVTINGSTATTASYTLTLPITGPSTSQCLQSGSSTASQLIFASCGAGGSSTLQADYTGSTGGTTPQITLTSGEGTLNIQDASTSIGTNLFDIRASTGSGLGQLLFGVGNTGAVSLENSVNSTTAFQIQNSTPLSVFDVDTVNDQVDIDATYALMSSPTGLTVTAASSGSGSLSNSTKYWYEITAIDNSQGETIPTAQSTGVTPTHGILDLYWTAVTGAYAYNIYRCSGSTACSPEDYLTTVLSNYSSSSPYADNGTITAGSATPPGTATANVATNTVVANPELSVGGYGTAAGQFYVSGNVPTASLATVGPFTNGSGFAVSGNYLYQASQSGLYTYDVSTPADPILVDQYSGSFGFTSVQIQGKYLFATTSSVYVFDISNPAAPYLITTFALPASTSNTYVQGRYMYSDTANAGLTDYDVSNPANIVTLGTSGSAFCSAGSIVATGRFAYALSMNSSCHYLVDFDVSSPNQPNYLAETAVGTAGDTLNALAVQGSYAYVADGTNDTVYVIDISNASSPYLVTSIATTDPSALTAVDHYLYVVNQGTPGNLQVIDISNPANPRSLGTVATVNSAEDSVVSVNGRYAYVGSQVSTNAYFQSYDLGGAYIQEFEAGDAQIGSLAVTSNSSIAGNESVAGGISVGASINVAGTSVLGGLTLNGLAAPAAPGVSATGGSGTTYNYSVAAFNNSGSSPPSASTSVSGGATLSGSVYNTITWSSVSGAVGYNVYRATTTGSYTAGYIGTVYNGATLSFKDTGAGSVGSVPTSNTAGSFTADGVSTFEDANNATNAFQVDNSSGIQIFNINTSSPAVTVNGTLSSDGDITANDGLTIQNTGAGTNALTVNNSLGLPILVAGSNNLLINGDFEGASTTGWAAIGTGASIALNTNPNYVYSGADSLAVTVGTTANVGTEVSVFNNPMAAGTYVLSFYAATATGSFATMEASFTSLGSSNCMSTQTVTTTFTYFSCTITTSGTTTDVLIGSSGTTAETFYIDAVQVVSSTNLVSNPGFENNITGWTASGTAPPTLSQNLVRADVYYGEASLKIALNSTASNEGATDSTFIATLPSATYTLSFYAMASTQITNLLATLNGVACLSSKTVVTTGFTEYSCSAASGGSPTILIGSAGGTASNLYVDDVQLTTGSTVLPYNIGQIQLRGVISNPVTLESTSNSTLAMQVDNATGGVDLSVDTLDGRVIIGSGITGESTPVLLSLDNDNSSNPTAIVNGAMFYNSSTGNFECGQGGIWQNCLSGLITDSVPGSAINTCTTACGAIATGTNAWPINYCSVGHVIHVVASGTYSTTGAPTLGIEIRVGTSATQSSDVLIGAAPTAATAGSGVTSLGWTFDEYIYCASTTTAWALGGTDILTTTAGAEVRSQSSETAVSTGITNQTQNIYLFPEWGTSSASNTLICNQFIVEGL